MKITRLEIKNYKQFKDLTLDLTYPLGHPKAGEPLDKICIIGQSGVGKTNLLNIINDTRVDNFGEMEYPFTEKSRLITKIKMKKANLITREFSNRKLNDIPYEKLQNEKLENEKIYYIKDSQQIDTLVWKTLKRTIENYNNRRLEYTDRLSNKLLNIDDYTKKDFQNDIQEWKSKNNNILEQISDKLNEVLIKFNIQLITIDINQKSYNELVFKDLSNNTNIYYNDLSTGTKNIISTFIPLKIHNPKDSIILIDEPENSFYPDIQRKLTELYMEVGENNQLIMATHSPLIASSFEPWEVVELKFDEDTHQIYRELYYDSENDERHIDNYTLDPRMLTWTGILTKIFDLEEDSNSDRKKELMKYARLKAKIKRLDDSIEEEEELIKLSKKLGLSN